MDEKKHTARSSYVADSSIGDCTNRRSGRLPRRPSAEPDATIKIVLRRSLGQAAQQMRALNNHY